jgi:hypothetical protein
MDIETLDSSPPRLQNTAIVAAHGARLGARNKPGNPAFCKLAELFAPVQEQRVPQ